MDGNISFISTESESENNEIKIPVHTSNSRLQSKPHYDRGHPVRKVVRRNNLILESMNLPVVLNINPRSIYNKSEDFELLIDQYEAEVICLSETWERPNQTLDKLLKLENFEIVSNVQQRDFAGGKPAILVDKRKFFIKKICPEPITVPTGVEAVWCLITPKNNCKKKFTHIAVASIYYRGPKSTTKKELFDHIGETYHFLSAKYGSNIQFLILGDTNRLNLNPILNLSPDLVQVVKTPTRLNPPAILDPIITTLSRYYEEPITKPPINPDLNSRGSPSDHLTVMMRPLAATQSQKPRVYRHVQIRPITDSGIASFTDWIESEDWNTVYTCTDPNLKAEKFQKVLYENFIKCFPTKSLKISDDDQPWITKKIKKLDRLRKREFFKNKKSLKWQKLNSEFLELCKKGKENYFTNIVQDLKESNTSQWFSKVKRMSGNFSDFAEITVDELIPYSDQDQAELIADHYASISQLYEPVSRDHFPEYLDMSKFKAPQVTCSQVEKVIKSMNKKAACVQGDVPMKIISEFSFELARPLSHLINSCFDQGVYPKIWKMEYITPVPKVHPPEKVADLRKISGLCNFSKVTDKIIAQYIVEDMQPMRDLSQYGNKKNLSIQHYLIKMLNTILKSLDDPSKSVAVILEMIDWAQAFDRQSHIQGIESFIRNGVRGSLIPILISFFQEREMKVKWKGILSSPRPLPGGGPQGGTLGTVEYTTQCNDNTDFIDPEEKWKFIDDLSLIEILNLLLVGLSTYDCQSHVPSDIGVDSLFLDSGNIKSQTYLDKLSEWTKKKEMKLNTDKSKYMIFNFTRIHQFTTRLQLEGKLLEQVHETRLLGLILRDDLSWKSNTKYLVKRA